MAVLGAQTLHFSLFYALLFISTYDPSMSFPIIPILGLPLDLLLSPLKNIFEQSFPSHNTTIPFFIPFTTVSTSDCLSPKLSNAQKGLQKNTRGINLLVYFYNPFQYFFVCYLITPVYFLNSSPQLYFECIKFINFFLRQ